MTWLYKNAESALQVIEWLRKYFHHGVILHHLELNQTALRPN